MAKIGTSRTFIDPTCKVPEWFQSQSLAQPHFSKSIIQCCLLHDNASRSKFIDRFLIGNIQVVGEFLHAYA
eukprot:4885824-Ditylum_brightwellii.AAC.1